MKMRNNIFQILLSFIDHTREWLAHHPRRQACGRCYSHSYQRSDRGAWDFYWEYVKRGTNADGKGFLKKQGNIIPSRFDIALFYIRLIFAYWVGVMPVCALNTLQKHAASKTKPSNASVDKHKSKYADYKRKRSQS